jgi:recombination protein RecA
MAKQSAAPANGEGSKKKSKKTKKKSSKKVDEKISDALLEQMRNRLGKALGKKGVLTRASEVESVTEVISTGHTNLDEILTPVHFKEHNIGGVPRGYLCEFFGPHAGGKSSLCLKLVANAQQSGGLAVWADAEFSFQDQFAANHGVDLDKLAMLGEPGMSAEEYLEATVEMAKSGKFKIAVIDSLAGLTPKRILDESLDKEARIGEKARLMSNACPKLVSAAKEGNCAIVVINQIRMKIGGYGNPETTPGGESLKFYSSLRLRVSQVGSKKDRGIMKEGEEIGIRSITSIQKSRFGPPYKETMVPIYYGSEKPSPIDQLLDFALNSKVITQRAKEGVPRFTFKMPDGTYQFRVLELFEVREMMTPDLVRTIANRIKEEGNSLDRELDLFVANVDERLGDVLEDEA